jgi:hypothetical protein
MFFSDHQLQSRPYVVDRTDLHVDEMHRQRNVADDVLGDVGWNFGRFLGPTDPYERGWLQKRHQLPQFQLKIGSVGDEDMRRADRPFRCVEQIDAQTFRGDLVPDAFGHPIPPDSHASLERQLLRKGRSGIAGGHQNSGVSSLPISLGKKPSCAARRSARLALNPGPSTASPPVCPTRAA